MSTSRQVILYIAMSLDGYIADKDDNLDFLSSVEVAGEDYGYAAFTDSVDAVIIGRKTYDKVIAMGYDYPHIDKDVYIITRTARPSIGSFQFYTGSLGDLVSSLKSQAGKHIYCDGGGEIVHELLKAKLIDELIISVIPVLLGEGRLLFQSGREQQALQLISSQAYDSGLVQLHYKVQ